VRHGKCVCNIGDGGGQLGAGVGVASVFQCCEGFAFVSLHQCIIGLNVHLY